MSTASNNRRYGIAGAAVLAVAAGAYGIGRIYPPLGPIAGTISSAQRFVDSQAGGQIPMRGRSVLVDAASARLFMIEDGRVRDSMLVIVGKPTTATPPLRSVLNYATLNPYWNVPVDLAQKLIAPRVLKDGTAYLTDRGYEVVSGFGVTARVLSPESVDWQAVAAGGAQVHVRQRPGPANSMGQIKFGLAQGNGIYLHDTPNKDLFTKAERNLSNGCIRLEDASRFARWLLGNDPTLASAAPEQHVALPGAVPITITYLDSRAELPNRYCTPESCTA
ncbi:MAG: L,D-transpeptidase family protein [Pseudomonadota bacterium]|jgi:murein L,D-transpeptidase YcbB/YkuD|nr:L,D-transpeptidase family protein [Pseudomonadota bacterium]